MPLGFVMTHSGVSLTKLTKTSSSYTHDPEIRIIKQVRSGKLTIEVAECDMVRDVGFSKVMVYEVRLVGSM